MRTNNLDLGSGPILPLLIKMSTPSMMAMFVMGIYNFVDAIWLARFDTQALAAYTASFPLQLLLFSIGVGTGIGSGSFASRMFGTNNHIKAKKAAGQTLFLSLVVGVIITAVVFVFCDEILRTFGAIPEIIDLGKQYLYIYILGTPMLLFVMMTNNLMRAEGRPNASMRILMLFACTGIVIDPILIFGLGPIPAMGLRGAACTTLIAYGLTSILAARYLYQSTSRYKIGWAEMKPNLSVIRSIYSTGLPSIIMNLIFTVTIILFNYALAPFGAASIASLGICLRTGGLINMVLIGVGHGVMPMVGFNKGAHAYKRVSETVRVGIVVCVSFAIICSASIVVFAPTIVTVFTSDPALLAYATPALRMFMMPLALSAPMVIWINMFLGLDKGVMALFLMSLRDCLFMTPMMLILPPLLGFKGIWIAYFTAIFLSTMVTFLVVRKTLARLTGDAASM